MATSKSERDHSGWALDDPVTRLRVWGGAATFDLPRGMNALTIGSAPDCGLRLVDPTNCISRHHATLVRHGDAWLMRDLDSTNGLREDGERRAAFQLAPGIEIEIGGVTLIAESARVLALVRTLSRAIGWRDALRPDVDRAVRAVREMATHRSSLVLCGPGNLISLARSVHAIAVGVDRPFVVVADAGLKALDRAPSGTICMLAENLPPDVEDVGAALTLQRSPACVLVCSGTRESARLAAMALERTSVVEVPAIGARLDELDRLIAEFAQDAATTLGASDTGFREFELTWLRKIGLQTLDDVAEATRRVVALRNWGVTEGADRLGISHPALSQWAKRRKIPT